eukprot:723238_1
MCAPEILKDKPYDKRVDYWSLGVIAFILLCGYPPFWGDTELDVAHSILGSRVQLDPDDWIHVSENGKRLVLGLLERNPHKRLGVDDILKHTWTYASKSGSTSVSKKQRKSFIKTVAKRRIRKMSMGVFEKNSKRMDYIYRHHKGGDQNKQEEQQESASPSAVSPMSLERQTSGSQHSATASAFSYSDFTNNNHAQRNSVSYSNDFRRWSRTDDDLFELRLPSMSLTPRSQAVLDPT